VATFTDRYKADRNDFKYEMRRAVSEIVEEIIDLIMAFRSGLEERVADLMCELGVKYEYESTKVPYNHPTYYTPDFLLPNGICWSAKAIGIVTTDVRLRNVKEQHPELDLRMVFQSPYNTISLRSLRQPMPQSTATS